MLSILTNDCLLQIIMHVKNAKDLMNIFCTHSDFLNLSNKSSFWRQIFDNFNINPPVYNFEYRVNWVHLFNEEINLWTKVNKIIHNLKNPIKYSSIGDKRQYIEQGSIILHKKSEFLMFHANENITMQFNDRWDKDVDPFEKINYFASKHKHGDPVYPQVYFKIINDEYIADVIFPNMQNWNIKINMNEKLVKLLLYQLVYIGIKFHNAYI